MQVHDLPALIGTTNNLPCQITEENVFIAMSDDVSLAGRVWRPATSEDKPVPAILEYLPYRQGDHTYPRDAVTHPYLAAHGYACLRVDIRGSGNSEGLLQDEYLPQEQQDALEIMKWLAAQTWCTGKVGMMGLSWGGFNSLQIAFCQPEVLKAIVTIASTDDRYSDDVHYMGGCMLLENPGWASTMMAYQSRPPDPAVVGRRWQPMWMDRLQNMPWLHETWIGHQHRDDYWKHASVCEDVDRIRCAVYAVNGWADGYSNTVPRLLKRLKTPRKGLVGSWGHWFPHYGHPGPAIGFLQEMLRWWDHWLKGEATGVMEDPMYRVWMQDSITPSAQLREHPGRWVEEDVWPSPRIEKLTFALNNDGLRRRARKGEALEICSPQSTGIYGGEWCTFGWGGDGPELPADQQEEDGRSLVFDSYPLDETLEILGAPELILNLASDRPVALAAVRLCAVAPSGASQRVTYGVLNLTHRESHETPEVLEPGKRYTVHIQLNDVAHSFPARYRVRVAISTSYWPQIWPAPEPVTLTLFTGTSRLVLPTRPKAEDKVPSPFGPPVGSPPAAMTVLRGERRERTVERDMRSNQTIVTILRDDGRIRLDDTDMELEHTGVEKFTICDDDPLSARAEFSWDIAMRRDNWQVSTHTMSTMTSSRSDFHVETHIQACEDDKEVFQRTWRRSLPRDLV